VAEKQCRIAAIRRLVETRVDRLIVEARPRRAALALDLGCGYAAPSQERFVGECFQPDSSSLIAIINGRTSAQIRMLDVDFRGWPKLIDPLSACEMAKRKRTRLGYFWRVEQTSRLFAAIVPGLKRLSLLPLHRHRLKI
jgi:hypothetical protein